MKDMIRKAKWLYILLLVFLSSKGICQDRFNLIYPHGLVSEDARQILLNQDGTIHILTTGQDTGESPFRISDITISPDGQEEESSILMEGGQYFFLNNSDATEYLGDGTLLYCGRSGEGEIRQFDSNGQVMWEYESGLPNNFLSGIRLSDGSFVACADVDFEFGFQIYRFNEDGEFVSLNEILPEDETLYRPYRIEELENGNLLISGNQADWDQDVFIDHNKYCCLIDSNDEILWSTKWGNEWEDDISWAIADEDQGLVYCAAIAPDSIILEDFAPYGGLGIWILNLDDGAIVDSLEFGPDTLFTHKVSEFIQTSDGGYAITGDSWVLDWNAGFKFGFLCKLDSNFNQEWFRTYSYVPFEEDQTIVGELWDLEQMEDGGFIMCGYHQDYDNPDNTAKVPWVIRTDECGYVIEECIISVEEVQETKSVIFPNPSNGILQWESSHDFSELRVYSSTGHLVHLENIHGLGRTNLSSLPAGWYLLEFLNEHGKRTAQPFILIEE